MRHTKATSSYSVNAMDLSIHLLSYSDQILTRLNSLAECTRTTKLLLSIACLNLFLCTGEAPRQALSEAPQSAVQYSKMN